MIFSKAIFCCRYWICYLFKIFDCPDGAKKKRRPHRANIEIWGSIRSQTFVWDIITTEMCYFVTSIWSTIHIVMASYQYLYHFFIVGDTWWGNIFFFLSFFRLNVHISIFLTIFQYVLSTSFQSQYFEAVKGNHKVCIDILKQKYTLHLLFVGN